MKKDQSRRIPRTIMIRHNMMKINGEMVYTPQKTPGIISRKQMDRILKEVLANG
jgi:hypothetical protein